MFSEISHPGIFMILIYHLIWIPPFGKYKKKESLLGLPLCYFVEYAFTQPVQYAYWGYNDPDGVAKNYTPRRAILYYSIRSNNAIQLCTCRIYSDSTHNQIYNNCDQHIINSFHKGGCKFRAKRRSPCQDSNSLRIVILHSTVLSSQYIIYLKYAFHFFVSFILANAFLCQQ